MERDQIDLQKTADMERLVNTTALKKMTQRGPEDPMKELDEMIGLEPVKQTIKEMVARMEFETEENKKKKKSDRVNMALSGRHFCFTGSPGTGKTSVARIMTSFLYKYGYIKENKCIEIDGNFLKAGTESALKTELILRHAYGGVLFIDEAYSLMDSSDNSGEQVIATLIKQMEDQRGKFILIIAGYTNEMRQLIATNPGFESRIKEYLHFPDYNAVEMREILCYMARKHNFAVDANALDHYDAIIARERRLRSFGNGRTARNVLDKVIDKHTLNLATGVLKPDDRYRLCSQDFQNIKLGGIGFDKEF
jgi:stage V sporulation protein K